MSRERIALDSQTTPGALCAPGVRLRAPVRRGARRLLLLTTAAVVAATGASCIREATFEPIGEDISLEGHWTVRGAAADATTCAAAGLATVEVVVYDGGTEHRYSALKWDCAAGSFDSSPRGILARGDYQLQWRAYDADGHERARDATQLVLASDLPVGAHVVLRPVDFQPPAP